MVVEAIPREVAAFASDSDGKLRDDISAVGALYRPGPMGANAHNDYADRKNGRQEVKPIHPELAEPLAEILGETFGLIVYQEQVMAIAQQLAGYSLGTADLLRRGKDAGLTLVTGVLVTLLKRVGGVEKRAAETPGVPATPQTVEA